MMTRESERESVGPAPGSVEFALAGADPVRARVGIASRSVPGKWNEDRVGVACPAADELASHGLAIAIADGVGGDGSGGQAAALAVNAVLRDYYATAASWTPAKALDRVLRSCNDWLWAQNARRRDADGALTTLSVLILRSDHYYLAHVGDTRVYVRRDDALKQLTTDHCWPRHDLRHVPKRALGLDTHLVVDFADGPCRSGDRFLLATDGVWEVLGDDALARVLLECGEPQGVADVLVSQSLDRQSRYMGRNDASVACVALGP